MATRLMEITIISARDLNNAIMFSKAKPFAVAWISNNYKSRQWTPVDNDNGTDPTWNQVMNFILDEADLQQGCLLLEIAIFTDTILGDREIGRVSVPLKEFLKPAGSNKAQFVSYQVRKPCGKAKGVLNLSVKLAEEANCNHQQEQLQAGTRSCEAAKAEPVTAYPAGVDEAAKTEAVTAYRARLDGVATAEPVTAYPAGLDGPAKEEPVTANAGYSQASSSSYPPANNPYYQGYPLPPHHDYPPPPHHGYPPPPHYGYPPPPPPHHGYPPPPPPHHGFPPPPPPHHGYPPHRGHPPYQGYPPHDPAVQQSPRSKNNKPGMGPGPRSIGGFIDSLLLGV